MVGPYPRAAPEHPWTGMRFVAARGSRESLKVTPVHPALVAEISADTAVDRGGVHRHPVRFKRLRLDVTTEEVPLYADGQAARGSASTRPSTTGCTRWATLAP
ncbi:hypothetical protein [Streptomyces sp. NPDC089795]|uniref:hypothetical protein n=1 Tax=Streptomyces sp. NPDC089795 TaxID=3155297 RepID=UPI00341488E8